MSSLLLIIIQMRKLYKLMTIGNISIELDDTCQAKDVSRVKIRLFEQNNRTHTYTLKQYALIQGNTLLWSEIFQFPYTGQTKLIFETYCEHQYGYNLEQLEVLYRGEYYIRNEMFFRQDTCHVYSAEGEKKGIIKWQIKVVTKEQNIKQQVKFIADKPLVRQDLIGLIRINTASLQITSSIFNHKKHQNSLQLKIKFGQIIQIYHPQANLSWITTNLKLEFVQAGPNVIQVQLLQDGKVLFDGKTDCLLIQQLKRYIRHNINIYNKNGLKIGILVLDYRFVAKQELLDLIYSPNNKLNYTQRSKSTALLFDNHSKQHTFLGKSAAKLPNKPNNSFFYPQHSQIQSANRYKIGYLMNRNSDILIPRASRFLQNKSSNPNISYIDPEKSSDFSPKKQRGPYITKGTKFDFTRQYKGHPGVGEYKLPSIWSKY